MAKISWRKMAGEEAHVKNENRTGEEMAKSKLKTTQKKKTKGNRSGRRRKEGKLSLLERLEEQLYEKASNESS